MDHPFNSPLPESTSTRDSGVHEAATERRPRVSDSSTFSGDAPNGDPTSPSDAAPAKSSRRRVKRPKKKKKTSPNDDDVRANGLHADVNIQGTGDSDGDSEARKERGKKMTDSEENIPQPRVDAPLNAANPEEISQLYSNEIFRRAAVQWLTETNQPLQALNHPSFQKLISIAARADRPINLPSSEEVRKAMMERRGRE